MGNFIISWVIYSPLFSLISFLKVLLVRSWMNSVTFSSCLLNLSFFPTLSLSSFYWVFCLHHHIFNFWEHLLVECSFIHCLSFLCYRHIFLCPSHAIHQLQLFLKLIKIWLHWVFAAFWGFSLVLRSGGYSLLQCLGISFSGFSCRVQALGWAGLSSSGTWALLLWGMWDLPRPGIKLMSPALSGRFLSTVPPGKSHQLQLWSLHLLALSLFTPECFFASVFSLPCYRCSSHGLWLFGLLFILKSETLNILWKIVGVEYWFVKSMSRCSSRTLAFHWAPTIANVGRAFLWHHLFLWARHSPDTPLWSTDGWTGPGCAG